jgi:hypothetical protein
MKRRWSCRGVWSRAAPPAVDVKLLHAKIGQLTLENDFPARFRKQRCLSLRGRGAGERRRVILGATAGILRPGFSINPPPAELNAGLLCWLEEDNNASLSHSVAPGAE